MKTDARLLTADWANYKLETLKEDIANGADVNLPDYDGITILMWAIGRATDPNIIQALIDGGADVNAQTKLGNTPLKVAVLNQKPAIVKLLIAAGADVNPWKKGGSTALMEAIEKHSICCIPPGEENGESEIIEILIAAGADVNAKTKDGNTPLKLASEWRNRLIRKLLIEAGAK